MFQNRKTNANKHDLVNKMNSQVSILINRYTGVSLLI